MKKETGSTGHFPITYIYDTSGRYEIFYRMVSKRHFEKVKVIFGVDSVEELKERLKKMEKNDNQSSRVAYPGSFDSVTPLYRLIEIEKVGTKR